MQTKNLAKQQRGRSVWGGIICAGTAQEQHRIVKGCDVDLRRLRVLTRMGKNVSLSWSACALSTDWAMKMTEYGIEGAFWSQSHDFVSY